MKFTAEEIEGLIWTFFFALLVFLYAASFIYEDAQDHKCPPPPPTEKADVH
jgi:hypothetical protein